MDDESSLIVGWLVGAADEPLSHKMVPGTTGPQRRALAALGALVGATAGEFSSGLTWPEWVKVWMAVDIPVPEPVRAAFAEGVAGEDGSEFLASIYERCVANVNRRNLGTFFTPPHLVTDMLEDWAGVAGAPASVVDIGAGVGAFTVAAARRWSDASVYAVDVNPITLGLLGVLASAQGLRLRPPSSSGPGLRLIADDYIAWSRDFESLPAPRLIIGNPPYTRHQLLSLEDRSRLAAALPEKVGSRASLATWMLANSLEILTPMDGLVLLLPANWLEADYALAVRQKLWTMTRRRVEMKLLGADVFPGARVEAVSLLVAPERTSAQRLAVSQRGTTTPLDRKTAPPSSLRVRAGTVRASGGEPLSSLAATRRGTATGANAFFLLSEAQREAANLPMDSVVPLLRRLRGCGERVKAGTLSKLSDEAPRWLLVAGDDDRRRHPALKRYIREGELQGFHLGLLCSRRDAWFDLRHDLVMPDVVFGPTTRDRFGVVLTDSEIAITNNLYGITWRPRVTWKMRTAVVEWLRSPAGQSAMKGAARHHAHDLFKLEPRGLSQLVVPQDVLNRGRNAGQ